MREKIWPNGSYERVPWHHAETGILKHALSNVDEICGYIDSSGAAVYVPNIHPSPADAWLMSAGAIPDGAKAVFHSHPRGPSAPSGMDMIYQYSSALPHGIACPDGVFWFGDDVPTPSLVGRGFRHGVTDCYELIRDTYRLLWGVTLPHVPREWKWWKQGQSLYNSGFRDAGFIEIDGSEILPGDCIIFAVASNVDNHAAVWLGDDLILHHLSSRLAHDPSRLSTVEHIGQMGRFISKVVRYENGCINRAACEEIRKEIRA